MATHSGKSVLIAGGSTGIGFGIARLFARAGASVAIVGRNPANVAAALESLSVEAPQSLGICADISTGSGVDRVMTEVEAAFGALDVLCINAGIFPQATIEAMSEGEWDQVLTVNVRSNFLCVQKALPLLRRSPHPRVVLTSSITGPITGIAGFAHYGASKAAQLGFMRAAAVELASDKITVNAVLPGSILTDGLLGLGQEFVDAAAASIPLGRLGTTDDIGHAVMFLASEEAGFITGQTLVIDGGQTLPESK
jgi:3-oxoacyl-[acyl-carrier protein] reductase